MSIYCLTALKINNKIPNSVIDRFRRGCNGINAYSYAGDFNFDNYPDMSAIVLRGMSRRKIIHEAIARGIDYYFIDTGYLGNHPYKQNPKGKKMWHRVTKNNLQQLAHTDNNPKRYEKLQLQPLPWKTDGRKILVCPPSEKTMKFHNIDLNEWTTTTLNEIKKHTDRPIKVRTKVGRSQRIPIEHELMDDVFAMVTFNSIAACESVYFGIPCFTNGLSAANVVTLNDLSKIETPYYPDRHEWLCSLANSQFTQDEMRSGYAWKVVTIT